MEFIEIPPTTQIKNIFEEALTEGETTIIFEPWSSCYKVTLESLTNNSSAVLETYFGPYFEDLLKETNLPSELNFRIFHPNSTLNTPSKIFTLSLFLVQKLTINLFNILKPNNSR